MWSKNWHTEISVLEIKWHHIIPKGHKIHSPLNIFHFEMNPLHKLVQRFQINYWTQITSLLR